VRRLLLGAAFLCALALPASAAAKTTYCSPTGDFCTSAGKLKGVRYLRITTFAFTGSVKICVKAPSTAAPVCHRFRLAKMGPAYGLSLIWKRHYPNRGAGVYRVSFFLGSARLGPVLSFRLP
jgi:hypothetical protein